MKNDRIYYINLKPYTHDLDFNEMITRLLNSDIGAVLGDPTYCRVFILEFMKKYNYIYVEKEPAAQAVDTVLSKKILQHLHAFFKLRLGDSTNKTQNHRTLRNKTLKNRKH